ncbi:MAG: putative hydrolase [Chthonomonadaceae bacterium]|nr:putative hydrolase [Chthonomonadaceae bacterium]
MPYLEREDARLFYEITGAGTPVLFIQGVGVIGAGWQFQTQALAGEFQCLTFDNRGIGQSTMISPSFTVEMLAQDAVALADAQGWEKMHVVGHSLGGIVAQEIALSAPQRVQSLSLLCTFAKGAQGTRMSPSVVWMGLRTRIGSPSMRRRAFLEMLFAPEYLAQHKTEELAAHLKPVLGRELAESPPILMKQLAALGVYDGSARLQELASIPTVVVSGGKDPIALSEYGVQLSALIPGSRYVEMTTMAHGLILQDTDRINTILRDHFRAAFTDTDRRGGAGAWEGSARHPGFVDAGLGSEPR